jgi:myo-inositol-1(or 4)-monophosphatase
VSEAEMIAPAAAPPPASADARAEAALASELLVLASEAARMAGALLLERAREGVESSISSKSTPTDLVSEADFASERAIRELLAARRPEDGFIGEEHGDSRPASSGVGWIVDPLDGTVNFLFGIPQWCVSVAVRDERGVLAGAIFDPNRDELFTATRGGEAALESPAGRVPLSGRTRAVAPEASAGAPGQDALASAMVATGLYYDARVRAVQAKVLGRLVGRVRDIRRLGSAALDLAWTAAGRYDAYFERGVRQWDIAAGALLCRTAGLELAELAAAAELPWGLLAAPPGLLEPLLGLVSRE